MGSWWATKVEEGGDPVLSALKAAYNAIFRVDMARQTIECIHTRNPYEIGGIHSVPMSLREAVHYWCLTWVIPEDREKVEGFCENVVEVATAARNIGLLRLSFTLDCEDGKRRSYDGFAFRYGEDLLLCCLESRVEAAQPAAIGSKIFIRAFGYFDIFVDGKPLLFHSPKEKELLALLVDRRGGTLTSEEAIATLWEDAPFDEKIHARFRKIAMQLKLTLEEAGIASILVNRRGVRNLDISQVVCDYYEYLKKSPEYLNTFGGNYMSNYSWGENTLGQLMKDGSREN